ncbi:MAG TPA: GTPase HflX [Terriglobia bacterium]|nr:GTPase HflX [Terriglobia bacterium]
MRRSQVPEKAYLAGWASTRRSAAAANQPDEEETLVELRELATSAGAEVVGAVLQRSPAPDPATLVGRGKVEEVRRETRALQADFVIFDHDLTPTQLRNLERALDLKVLDRTQLILDIFARRALSREGKLQVELAQLNYLLPRLAGQGTVLSRLGGGIGTRGPGEQQLEFDRRRIRTRIRRLKEAIERVRTERALHREHRRSLAFRTIALVGYTNAGKSTLFNALTRAQVTTSSRLFATLDPTVRSLDLPSRRPALLSDTVGFIHKLPPHLVAAFRATLEELEGASLLVHVTDASHAQHQQQDAAVEALLETLGLGSTPRLHVWNKIDLLDTAQARDLAPGPYEVGVSARSGEGLDDLLRRIDAALCDDPLVEAQFDFSSADGERLAMLHRCGEVLETRFEDERVHVRVRVSESLRARLDSSLRQADKPAIGA